MHRPLPGQLELLEACWSDQARAGEPERLAAHGAPAGRLEERPAGDDAPGDCLWGCRGTAECLCGQGEFSDHPSWFEAD